MSTGGSGVGVGFGCAFERLLLCLFFKRFLPKVFAHVLLERDFLCEKRHSGNEQEQHRSDTVLGHFFNLDPGNGARIDRSSFRGKAANHRQRLPCCWQAVVFRDRPATLRVQDWETWSWRQCTCRCSRYPGLMSIEGLKSGAL